MSDEEPGYLDFAGTAAGPSVVILGGVHGNEPAGTLAIERFAAELRAGTRRLLKGRLRMIPVCNPRAQRENKRYCEVNLNRVFEPGRPPQSYEERLAQRLMEMIGRPDFLLDLHSFHTPGPTLALRDVVHPLSDAILKKLPVEFLLSGWPELYRSLGIESGGGDTISWIGSQGSTGICVECGQHEEPEAAGRGYECLLIALVHLGMLPAEAARPAKRPADHLRLFAMTRHAVGAKFAKEWRGFDRLAKGETVGFLADGTAVRAPKDAFIVFPKPLAQPGEEWFYLAEETREF